MNNVLGETVSGTIDVGVSFNKIGGGAFVITDKLFDTQLNDGDVCLIFNPVAYNYDWYQYYADVDGEGNPGWMITDMATWETTTSDSFNVNGGDSLVFIPADQGATPKVSISGEVADLNGASRSFVIDLESDNPNDTMFPISNPYPIDTTVKMFSDFVVDGDVLLVWNDAAYNYDWYQYYADVDGEGNPGWMITDMATWDSTTLTADADVVLKAGHGAVFIPAVDGTRTWTVTL